MNRVPHVAHWGAFDAVTEDGRLTGVVPSPGDPEPSPLVYSVPDAVYHRSRVTRPAVRWGWLEHGPGGRRELRGADSYVEVSWERALDLVAGELDRVRGEHGNQAIFGGSYGWSSAGRFHHAKTQLQRFLTCLGGFTGQTQNYSYAAALTLLPHVVGTTDAVAGPLSSWDGIAEHTDLFVSFGGFPVKNSQIEAGGLGAHSSVSWLRRCRDAGVEFVGIGPVRDEPYDLLGADWIGLRPGTDVALLLGLAHTLATEGGADRAFLTRYCVGYPEFERYLLGETDGVAKDAEWSAGITHVPAATVRGLAHRMAAGRTMINGAWALQRADHGEQPLWMIVTLAAMLGQIGVPGGGFGFGYLNLDGQGAPGRRVPSPALPTGRNPIDTEIPVARIADLLLHPGESYEFDGATRTYPDVRLVYWCGGNPFHHHQDLNRLARAFRRPETIVVHEQWWTATARRADIVLPATTTLERNDLAASPRYPAVHAMRKAIEPVGEARDDYTAFSALAARLGVEAEFAEGRDEPAWLRHLYESWRERASRMIGDLPAFDEFWTRGYVTASPPDEPYVLFGDFRGDPDAHPLHTPSGRIEIHSARIAGFGYDDCPGHPVWLEPVEWLGSPKARTYPLHLVSDQPRTRLHGQLDDVGVSRQSKVHGREPIAMHPDDAAARGVEAGSVVRVFNDRGALLAGVVLDGALLAGVVRLATGAWYDPLDPGELGELGTLEKHGNPNVLTLDKGTSRLAQGPIAHSALVDVAPWTDPLPPVTVFDPPVGTSTLHEKEAER